ncbi:MAG: hypothetical protein ACPGQS_15235 [Bradymonadia bacterium]
MLRTCIFVVSVFALGCGKKSAKLSELSSDQLSEVCGDGTSYSVDKRSCEPQLGAGVVLDAQGNIVVDEASFAEELEAARAAGVASVELVTCGEGTILSESESRCRPALSENVELDAATLLIVPNQTFTDSVFAEGVSSVTVVSCGDGTTLTSDGRSCAPNLSDRVSIVEGLIDVTDEVLQSQFSDGVNSVQIVLCDEGTVLSADMTQCEPVLSDDVEVTDDGVIAPTTAYADEMRQDGADSVVPIICDDASGVILNSEGTECVARLSIDVYFDGNQIVPTQAYRDDIFELGASQLSCGPGTNVSPDGFRCEPALSIAISQDGSTGELQPSPAYESAAQACGVTVANSSDGAARTVVINETQDGFECVLLP